MGEVRRRRPWLAVLLALVISGLGHAYLRRWGRALGWYIAITATLVFIVPDAAVDQLLAGTPPPIGELAPALAVIVASVVDAYVIAIRNNREYDRQQTLVSDAATTSVDATAATQNPASANATSNTTTNADSGGDCPNCGRELDPALDFCHWCTESLHVSADES